MDAFPAKFMEFANAISCNCRGMLDLYALRTVWLVTLLVLASGISRKFKVTTCWNSNS